MNKINTELSLIEKIVAGLKEVYAMNKIEEADEIVVSVDAIIENAEKHVQDRLDKAEEESVMLSNKSQVNDDEVSLASSYVKQKQLEAKQASERLAQVEEEQKQKELELERITAELQLTKQRTEEARKVAALNQLRANTAE
jgi:transcription initiation factor IIF auxiliary subunit